MFEWPEVDLTDYERTKVRYYRTDKFPGVLKRIYPLQLITAAGPEGSQLTTTLTQQIQVSRRMRVHKLTFAGDIGAWQINIFTASGEKYTQEPALVASLGGMAPYDALANVSYFNAFSPILSNEVQEGLLIEPNWEMLSNQTLVFEGTPLVDPVDQRITLLIGVHVWEYPGM